MRELSLLALLLVTAGCSALPDVAHQPQIHNPFPQLSRVAVLPFFNQSAEPTVDGDQVALAYFNELQAIPGFEVVPVGVTAKLLQSIKQNQTREQLFALGRELNVDPATMQDAHDALTSQGIVVGSGEYWEGLAKAIQIDPARLVAAFGKVQTLLPPTDSPEYFQQLARAMDVDAVVVGSITEYTPYYPPRMGLSVRWYAANPSFHPIPAGYGLPWGTAEEEFIPESLVFDAEFALAKEQLKTQTPPLPATAVTQATVSCAAAGEALPPTPAAESNPYEHPSDPSILSQPVQSSLSPAPQLPADWPDPRGFVPPPPRAQRPQPRPQTEPVLSHTRLYHGNDADFTKRLANYFYFRDDARFGDWQGYLQRTDDFVRFCCHLHITEMLAARGGAGKTRVVWRWPIGRYER